MIPVLTCLRVWLEDTNILTLLPCCRKLSRAENAQTMLVCKRAVIEEAFCIDMYVNHGHDLSHKNKPWAHTICIFDSLRAA